MHDQGAALSCKLLLLLAEDACEAGLGGAGHGSDEAKTHGEPGIKTRLIFPITHRSTHVFL